MTVQKTSFATSFAAAFLLVATTANAQYPNPAASPYAASYGAQSPFYQASQAISSSVGNCTTTCVPQVAQVCTPIRYRVENRQTTHVENRQVQRTVMVPQTVTEKRKVRTTEVQPVTRQREVTHYEQRPEERVENRRYTVMEPVTRVRKERYTQQRPVTETRAVPYTEQVPVRVQKTAMRTEQRPYFKMVKQTYTEQIPQVETRQGMRTASKCVPVQRQRVVYQDSGYWAEQPTQTVSNIVSPISYGPTASLPVSGIGNVTGGSVSACCVPVDCCQTTCGTAKVWVPRRVASTQAFTEMVNQTVQEPYEYKMTTYKPVQRERMVKVQAFRTVQVPEKVEEIRFRTVSKTRNEQITRFVPEEKTRDVRYVSYEPREKVEKVRVTAYRTVPVKRTESYTAMVPRTVEREVDVPTTRMVQRSYSETVPVTVQRSTPVTVAELGTPTVTAGAFGGQLPSATAAAMAQQQVYAQQMAAGQYGQRTASAGYGYQQAYAQQLAYARQQQAAAGYQRQLAAAAYARQAQAAVNPYARTAAVPYRTAPYVPRTAANPFGYNPFQQRPTLAQRLSPFMLR